jgi:murein DD-endopeptidase
MSKQSEPGAGPTWIAVLVAVTLLGCSSVPQRPEVPATTAARAARAAASMVGRPYHYGGDTPRGFDCSGLIEYSYRQAGVSVPRTVRGQRAVVQSLGDAALRPGDLLFFDTRAGKAAHVGIYLGQGMFVHAPSGGKRVMRSALSNPFWEQRLVTAGRVTEQ